MAQTKKRNPTKSFLQAPKASLASEYSAERVAVGSKRAAEAVEHLDAAREHLDAACRCLSALYGGPDFHRAISNCSNIVRDSLHMIEEAIEQKAFAVDNSRAKPGEPAHAACGTCAIKAESELASDAFFAGGSFVLNDKRGLHLTGNELEEAMRAYVKEKLAS